MGGLCVCACARHQHIGYTTYYSGSQHFITAVIGLGNSKTSRLNVQSFICQTSPPKCLCRYATPQHA